MTSKRICIDIRMLNSSGIGTYLQGLLGGIRALASSDYSFSLLGDPRAIPQGPWAVETFSSPIYSLREQWQVPLAFKNTKSALLHAPHYNLPWAMAAKTIVTVHDLIHLKFPDYWPSALARGYAHFFFHHVVTKAKAILTVSENTKRDLIDMLSIPAERITVTYNAVSHDRFQRLDPSALEAFERLHLPKDYLLYVGNLKEFKNVRRLVEAYRRLRSMKADCPVLVLAGRNFMPGFEKELASVPGLIWIGEADRDLLPCLYRNALAFLFPSLYEGFGLPPLEAMASGTPVMCSNRASLPEVVGDAALMIDPEKTEEMTAAMARLIDDSLLRKDLAARGLRQAARFSWETMTQQTLAAYERCLS
jgi:glycosyltransferase involved in cell wall biosynthesis